MSVLSDPNCEDCGHPCAGDWCECPDDCPGVIRAESRAVPPWERGVKPKRITCPSCRCRWSAPHATRCPWCKRPLAARFVHPDA